MSDGYPTLRLRADIEGQEFPWTHQLPLNGRRLLKLTVTGPTGHPVQVEINGTRYIPAPRRDWDDCEVE